MNYKVVSKIACRVLAVYVFMQYFSFFLGSLFQYFIAAQKNHINGSIFDGAFLVSYLPMLIFSILLWVFSDKLAGAIAGKSEENTEIRALDYTKVQYIAFSFVGILILCSALPSLISNSYQTMAMLKDGFITKDSMNYISNISGILQSAVRLVVGLCLVLGSKGIVRAIHKFRNAGIIEAEEKQDL